MGDTEDDIKGLAPDTGTSLSHCSAASASCSLLDNGQQQGTIVQRFVGANALPWLLLRPCGGPTHGR